jgi:4-hydroxy-2-oxoheptanedioate aldolase
MAFHGVAGLVRVQSLELGSIGRALDLGATGIIVPLVETAADAERAVHATTHAPRGGRSYGMQTSRVGPFDGTPFVVIQIETKASIENVDALAAVKGVDALYIGPADLGLALVGEPADPGSIFDGSHTHSGEMSLAFEAVISACSGAGAMPGLHCDSGEVASLAVGMGFRMTSVAADIGLVGDGLRDQLSKVRNENI